MFWLYSDSKLIAVTGTSYCAAILADVSSEVESVSAYRLRCHFLQGTLLVIYQLTSKLQSSDLSWFRNGIPQFTVLNNY